MRWRVIRRRGRQIARTDHPIAMQILSQSLHRVFNDAGFMALDRSQISKFHKLCDHLGRGNGPAKLNDNPHACPRRRRIDSTFNDYHGAAIGGHRSTGTALELRWRRGCRGSDPRLLRLTMDALLDQHMWGATPCIKVRQRPRSDLPDVGSANVWNFYG
jgi:hypothetical protein